MSSKSKSTDPGVVCKDEIAIEKYSFHFEWVIPEFRYGCSECQATFISPQFCQDEKSEFKWYLELKKATSYYDIDVVLYLCSGILNEHVNGTYKFNFSTSGGKTYSGTRGILSRTNVAGKRSYNKQFLNEILTTEAKTFVISVDIHIFGTNGVKLQDELIPNFNEYADALFGCNFLTDFTVKVNDLEFRVHKLILAAQSPVMEAIFRSGLQEHLTSRLEINDFEPSVVEAFLRFMYTHKVSTIPSCQFALDLYQIADMYNVEELKDVASGYLTSTMNESNVMTSLFMADSHSDEALKTQAMNFIRDHPSCCSDRKKTYEFLALKPELLFSLISFFKQHRK